MAWLTEQEIHERVRKAEQTSGSSGLMLFRDEAFRYYIAGDGGMGEWIAIPLNPEQTAPVAAMVEKGALWVDGENLTSFYPLLERARDPRDGRMVLQHLGRYVQGHRLLTGPSAVRWK